MGSWDGSTPLPSLPSGHEVLGAEMQILLDLLTALTASWTNHATASWASSGTAPAVGNGTISGEYVRVGHLGILKLTLTLGSTSTVGTGTYNFPLPTGWTISGSWVWGAGAFSDASTGFIWPGTVWFSSSTSINLRLEAGTVSATVPAVPANGDSLRLLFIGELD